MAVVSGFGGGETMRLNVVRMFVAGCFTISLAMDGRAQGVMLLSNRGLVWGLDAPISFRETGTGLGPGYSAGVYYNDRLVPGSITIFRENPESSQYVLSRIVAIPGTQHGAEGVVVEMRVWPTSAGSYEATPEAERGTSGPLTLTRLPDNNSEDYGHFPATFTGFQISISEPSTFAVGVLGAAAFLVRRRKRRREV